MTNGAATAESTAPNGRTTKKKAKASSKKKASKKVTKKATKKKAKAGKKKAGSRRTVAAPNPGPDANVASVAEMQHDEMQGVRVLLPTGKKHRSAQAYLHEKQIKIEKDHNPRGEPGDFSDLRDSIKKNGILQPLVVRPSGDGKTFGLVAGERRLLSARELGEHIAEEIPVIIRSDLEGDDVRARAVAIAENSDDARSALNPMELADVCEQLKGEGWSPQRIHSETALSLPKVRRLLRLHEVPETIQEKVRAGELAPRAAEEFYQIPAEHQAAIAEKVGPGTTHTDVRRIRKQIEAEKSAEDGSAPATTSRGTPPQRPATSWKPAREKSAMLAQVCARYKELADKGEYNDEFYEHRGIVGWLLYDRGDIPTCFLAPHESDEAAHKKTNKMLETIIGNEAARHKPDSGEGGAA